MMWLQSKLLQYGLIALLVLGFLAEVFRRGASWEQKTSDQDDLRKEREGRNAVFQEQAETDGLSSSDLVNRMRSRDNSWGGV